MATPEKAYNPDDEIDPIEVAPPFGYADSPGERFGWRNPKNNNGGGEVLAPAETRSECAGKEKRRVVIAAGRESSSSGFVGEESSGFRSGEGKKRSAGAAVAGNRNTRPSGSGSAGSSVAKTRSRLKKEKLGRLSLMRRRPREVARASRENCSP